MSMGTPKEFDRGVAAEELNEPEQSTSAMSIAGRENGFSYARSREMLFELLKSANVPDLSIWISGRASLRAQELREEYKRGGISV